MPPACSLDKRSRAVVTRSIALKIKMCERGFKGRFRYTKPLRRGSRFSKTTLAAPEVALCLTWVQEKHYFPARRCASASMLMLEGVARLKALILPSIAILSCIYKQDTPILSKNLVVVEKLDIPERYPKAQSVRVCDSLLKVQCQPYRTKSVTDKSGVHDRYYEPRHNRAADKVVGSQHTRT